MIRKLIAADALAEIEQAEDASAPNGGAGPGGPLAIEPSRAAPATLGVETLTNATATPATVSDEAQLTAALAAIDVGGSLSQTDTSYTIKLAGSFPLSKPLEAIDLASGDTLTLNGAGGTIDSAFPVFSIEAGAVTIENLSINSAHAVAIEAGQQVTLVATAGRTVTIDGAIDGDGPIVRGPGTVVFAAANSFSGGITLQSGALDLASAGAAGTGDITFAGPAAKLTIEAGDAPTNAITGLAAGDAIDLKGIGLLSGSTLAASATLTVAAPLSTVTLDLDPTQNFNSFDFQIASDGHGGTLLKVQTLLAVESLTDATSTGKAYVTGGQTVTFTLTTTEAATVSAGTALTLSNGATALYSGDGSASATNSFTYTVGAGDTWTPDLTVTGYSGSIVDQNSEALAAGQVTEDTGVTVYPATTFAVANESQLNAALAAIDAGGVLSKADQAYSINLAAGFTLSSAMDHISLANGDTLTLNGGGATIDGGGVYQGLVVDAGDVTIENLTVADATAQGAAGQGVGGGGGAGLGGGLFVASGAGVTLADVLFTVDTARGGAGGDGAVDDAGSVGGTGRHGAGVGAGQFGGGAGGLPYTFITFTSSGEHGRRETHTLGGGGGGGLGAGGDVFVQQGGRLTVEAGTLANGAVAGGRGGGPGVNTGLDGDALGSALFIAGNQQVALMPGAGETLTVAGGIADQTGSGGTGADAALGSLLVDGQGTVKLTAVSTFAGGVTLQSGVLDLASPNAAGTGAITFAGASAELKIEHGDLPANAIAGLSGGGLIELVGLTANAATVNASNELMLTQNGVTVATLQLAGDNSGIYFMAAAVSGGTQITAVPTVVTVAQYSAQTAFYQAIPGGFSIADTAANITAALPQLESAASHLTAITATDAGVALSLSQALGFEVANVRIAVPAGDALAVHGAAANIEALTPAQISALVAMGASSLTSTNASVSFTPAQTAAIVASGLAVATSGNFTVTENTANGFTVYRGGQPIEQKFVKPDGSYEIGHSGITGQPHVGYENVFNAAQARVAEAFSETDGSGRLVLYAPGLKLAVAPAGDTLTTGPDSFHLGFRAIQTISAGYRASETFALAKGFGQVSVSGFTLKGAGHDTIDLSVSMFSYLTSAMTQAQDLAAVLSHAATSGGALTITDTAAIPDTLTLAAVTKAELTANPADVVFAGASAAKTPPAVAAFVAPHEDAAPSASLSAKQRFIEAISTLRYSHGGGAEPLHAWHSDRIAPGLFASIAAPR